MDYSSSQVNIADTSPAAKWTIFSISRLTRPDISLLIETAIVIVAAVLAVRIFTQTLASGAACFVVPATLVAAALIPSAIRRRKFAEIGFNIEQSGPAFLLLCRTCAVVFPLMFCGFWLLKKFGIDLPLRPLLPKNKEWASWLFYQFMYVAVAEEVFFRGYVQGNILMLANTIVKQGRLQQWISIVLSSACFAVAHILVQGQIISGLTFLPGLILGWLFIRTRSLLGPILFHGLANTCYFVTAAIFA